MAAPSKDFLDRLAQAGAMGLATRALAILWAIDSENADAVTPLSDVCEIIRKRGFGNPNPSRLKRDLVATRHVLTTDDGLQLKAAARATLRTKFAALSDSQPVMDHSTAYLPEAVWKKTRGYVESTAAQLNGCFLHAYYDGASVMLRRLVETLIIEVYEHLGRQAEIKDTAGNYFMLSDLITRANSQTGIGLGRDGKRCLDEVKALGDRSAHNRRFTAKRGDLQKIEGLVRVGVEELIVLAKLRSR